MTERCSPESAELLPCPFCGQSPFVDDDPDGVCCITCATDDCLGVEITCPTFGDAQSFWNRRAPAQSAWQPIETAPKDGTICDLWLTGGGRMTDQWWDEEDQSWCGLEQEMFSHWILAPVSGPALSSTQRNEVKP